MELPDGRPLILAESVLAELSSTVGQFVLWLPGERAGGFRHWRRITTAARAPLIRRQGVHALRATSVPAHQRLANLLGKVFPGLTGTKADRIWTLPDGSQAEQCGPRENDVILAWAEDESAPLDEARIRMLWPECRAVRLIGRNLYLVSGAEPERLNEEPSSEPSPSEQESSAVVAERLLADARGAGSPRRIITALTDLGLVFLHKNEARQAATILEEALGDAQRLGDRSSETDVIINLALAYLMLSQPARAGEILIPALVQARAAGNPYSEKLVLDRLGHVCLDQGDPQGVLSYLEQARSIAAELDDRSHEAGLLWRIAIQHAELGRRDVAITSALAAINRLRSLKNPEADWYAHHLSHYVSGASSASLTAPGQSGRLTPDAFGGSIDASVASSPSRSFGTATTVSNGPGILRMAFTATKSMAKFLGSGLKTSSPETYQSRLKACSSCVHHTGLRCRVCGCMTRAKAKLDHERCPIGAWPA